MRIAIAQLNQMVGDLPGNAARILDAVDAGRRGGADLVVTPELSLCGYPPEDLLLRPAFLEACALELGRLATRIAGPTVVVGYPERGNGGLRHNAVAVIRDGRIIAGYRKRTLPNYTVFDEQRYFTPGIEACVFDVAGVSVGVVICEDIWFPGPARRSRDKGAELIVVPNGSPYHTRQQSLRRGVVTARAVETG
ncbi:MAG: nitrilase-related carbon-nitrogen hydrolase, partial [Betaproteobacteria bacterium]